MRWCWKLDPEFAEARVCREIVLKRLAEVAALDSPKPEKPFFTEENCTDIAAKALEHLKTWASELLWEPNRLWVLPLFPGRRIHSKWGVSVR